MTTSDTAFDMTPTSAGEFWITPLLPEVETVWGRHRVFKEELPELCYSAFLLAYYDRSLAAIRERKALQQAFMSGAETGTGLFNRETINKLSRAMPTDSFSEKVLRNICDVTFSDPPQRIWTGDDAKDAAWGRAYKEARADIQFAEAYRLALQGNVAAVRPLYNSQGKRRIQVLPRDRFRVITEGDGETVREMWVPMSTTGRDGKRKAFFQVWTADAKYYADQYGEPIRNPFLDPGEPEDNTNPYGRVPYSFLRMRESLDDDFYGGGWHDLALIQVFNNVIQVAETRAVIYGTFNFLVAINMGMKKRGSVAIGPDALLDLNGVEAAVNDSTGGLLPPSLETLELRADFKGVQEWRLDTVREYMAQQGIPRHFFEDTGSPVSGAALKVMEREIVRERKAHKPRLQAFESDFAELAAVVWNADRIAPPVGVDRLDEALPDFEVSYPDEPDYIEPTEAYDLDRRKLEDGVLYPSTFFARYSGSGQSLTDAEAVQAMEANKALLAGPDGSTDAPTPETPVTGTEGTTDTPPDDAPDDSTLTL